MKLAASLLVVGLIVSAGTSPAVADRTPEAATGAAWHEMARETVTEIALPAPDEGPWLVVGPFDRAKFDFPFAPESNPGEAVDPDVAYRGRQAEPLSWKPVEIPAGANFNLRSLCPGRDADGTFYLARTISSNEPRTYAVSMRGTSGITVWLNGRQFVDRGPGDGWLGGGWDPKEVVLLPLAAGENRLLVKVHGLRKYGAWHFLYGGAPAGAVRYTVSKAITRKHPGAFPGLTSLRRDGLDLLKIWPAAGRDADTTARLLQGTKAALARSDAWLKFLEAAKVPQRDLAAAYAPLTQARAELARQTAGEAPDSERLASLYFSTEEASRSLQDLPQGQIIQNWLQLDQLSVQSPMDAKAIEKIAAALQRGRALLDDYASRSAGSADAADRLNALQQRLDAPSLAGDAEAVRQLYVDARQQVRDLALNNPALAFREILFYKRYTQRTMNIHRHQFPSSRYADESAHDGGDLYVLTSLRPDAELKPLLQGRLGRGLVRGYDLSYDGRRVVFGFWDSQVKRPAPKTRFEYDCYVTEGHANIYELDLESGKIRQLTDDPWHDIDPCYLPGGRIAFASERCGYNAQCDPHPWSEVLVNLYTISGDGSDVRRLIANKDSDNFPRVLNDGRVFYTHWEYHERHWLHTQSLWVSRPDGTQQDALFKQHLNLPLAIEEGRAIPGTNKVAAIATGHHTNAAGAVVRVNFQRGNTAAEAIEIVTPGVSPFEGGLNGVPVPEGGVGGIGYYMTPWPISEKYFLASYNPTGDMTRAEGFGIYLIDVFGNRELIYRDPNTSCFSPVPLTARRMPPILKDRTDPNDPDATLVITDVHQGMDVSPGTVKYLRINESMPWPYTKEGAARYTVEHDWTIKRTLGLVPVEADGSAHFVVPADVGVYFQALDENFVEVRRMRSLVSFQPGERRSCTGCHETQDGAPPTSTTLAGRREPSVPEAPSWGSEHPISFLRDVQPVLDRHCTRCHSGLNPAGNVDLFGGLTGASHPTAHNTSYDALTKYVPRANFHGDFQVTQPYQFGSAQSKLVKLLQEGHEDIELNRDEWLRLLTWVDMNGLYLGSFISVHDWGRWGYRPQQADMQAVKEIQQRRCDSCHDGNLAGPENIAPKATVSATSEHSGNFTARRAVDGRLDGNWAVNGKEAGDQAEFTLQWDNPVFVAQIVYAGRTTALIESWKDYEVYLDDDDTPAVRGVLKNVHGPQRIAVEKRRVQKVRLKFLNSHTPEYNPGASEIAVYSSSPSDRQLAAFLSSRRQDGLAQPGWIHPRDPAKSLYLLAPLAANAGGWGKCSPKVFTDTSDPDYRALLGATRKIWQRMREDPTPGMKELIAAEGKVLAER